MFILAGKLMTASVDAIKQRRRKRRLMLDARKDVIL